jgi:transposase-like protein
MMAERGVVVSHTTITRWVLRHVPGYARRWARYSRAVDPSWRMDETAASFRGDRHYLYRAVDRREKSMDSVWKAVVVIDRRYLNNIVEQNHRPIKRRCASMSGFKSFRTAAVTLAGVELAHRIHKCHFS